MDITELKSQIVKNNLSNFYIFTGYEIGIINIYLNQMSKVLNMPITRADSVASIYNKCASKSMFGSTRGFYVIRDDNDFNKQEKVWERIKTDIKDNVIVLLYEKLDSRLKFGKYFKDDIVVFEKLTPTVLNSYIKKSCNLSDYHVNELSEICGGSYDLCMLEIDKIKQYAESENYSVDSSMDELIDSGVIYQPEETDVFKFVSAVLSRDKIEAYRLAKILLDNGSSSINLLGTLYNSAKAVLLIQCAEGNNISEITGLDNRQIYFNKKYVGKYRSSDLVYALKEIASAVEGIKNGLLDDKYATVYILVRIM